MPFTLNTAQQFRGMHERIAVSVYIFPFSVFQKKHGKPKQSRGSPATECNNLPIRRSEKANREKGRESEQKRKTLVKNQNKNNKQFQSDYVALFHCIGIWKKKQVRKELAILSLK